MDIRIENHGTIFLFHAESDAGLEWLEENVQAEDWQWLGKALSVEHRYAHDLAKAAVADGLKVS